MTISNVGEILLAIALLVWVIYRQLTWRTVAASSMWRMPLIMGAVGILMLAQMKDVKAITPLDITLLLIELVISFGLGAAMGRMAIFRTRPQRESDVMNRRGERTAEWSASNTVTESRTGGLGLVLWLVLIAVRVGIDLFASQLGAALITATGTILVALAVNRVARALVIGHRLEQHRLVNA
jgi:hypothetical protein